MLLRRIMEHTRHQNWTAIVIDFAIVVIGVYLGLQVQEWSGSRADRQRELQIVEDMISDLEVDRNQYAVGIESTYKRVSAANASLVGAGLAPISFEWNMRGNDLIEYSFDETRIDQIPVDQQDNLWTDVVIGFFPNASTATLDAMISAGDTKVIRDRDLVRAVQAYYGIVESVRAQNEKVIAIRGDVLRIGASYGLAPDATTPADDYFKLVASEPELAAAIRLQATFAIYHRGDLENAYALAAELQDRLTAYLEAMN